MRTIYLFSFASSVITRRGLLSDTTKFTEDLHNKVEDISLYLKPREVGGELVKMSNDQINKIQKEKIAAAWQTIDSFLASEETELKIDYGSKTRGFLFLAKETSPYFNMILEQKLKNAVDSYDPLYGFVEFYGNVLNIDSSVGRLITL